MSYSILILIGILLLGVIILLYRQLIITTENKIKNNINIIKETINNASWSIYRYSFIKKIYYLEFYYKIKYHVNDNISDIVLNNEIINENRSLTLYDFYDDELCEKLFTIIKENKKTFDSILVNDPNIIKFENIIEDCEYLLKILENKEDLDLKKFDKIKNKIY